MSLAQLPEYHAWRAMIRRCTVKHDKSYPHYGERGITVCDRWRSSFEAFYADMGPRPTLAHSIDRIDNDKDYCPKNCKWATRREQENNKRRSDSTIITVLGASGTIVEWASTLGVYPKTIRDRIRKGMTGEEAVTTPFRGGRGKGKGR